MSVEDHGRAGRIQNEDGQTRQKARGKKKTTKIQAPDDPLLVLVSRSEVIRHDQDLRKLFAVMKNEKKNGRNEKW